MSKILKYNEFGILEEFVEYLTNPLLNESNIKKDSDVKKILKQLSNDLKFNYSLIFTFGAGIGAMLPIVDNLIKKSNLNVELTNENLVLLGIACIAISYLEESKNKTGEEHTECIPCDGLGKLFTNNIEEKCGSCDGTGVTKSLVTKEDVQTILEELKLRGIGNGIVKKLVKCITTIGDFLKMIFRNTPVVITTLLDLFGYTAIMVPTMNAISMLVNNNNWTLDTLPVIIAQNLLAFGVGVSTFLVKRGFEYISDKIKDFLKNRFGKKSMDIKPNAIPNDKMINEQ